MNRLCVVLVVSIVTLGACSKDELTEDRGCIERSIIPVTAHSINNADIDIVNNLLAKNGIKYTTNRYTRFIHDTLHTLYPPYIKYDEKGVLMNQYTNGLQLFNSYLFYHFLDDSLTFQTGNSTKGTSLNTVPQLTLGQVRKLFLTSIDEFDHAAEKFKDSCFKAELGYYNLNAGTNNTSEVLVKSWRVTLKNSTYPSEFPIAYYQDKDGRLISYDNGIQTFKAGE